MEICFNNGEKIQITQEAAKQLKLALDEANTQIRFLTFSNDKDEPNLIINLNEISYIK